MKKAKKIKKDLNKIPPPNNLTRKNEVIILLILFFIAFLLRMMTYNSIFVGNNVRFLEFDPFYHMRRAVSFAENFPHIWGFDTYIDYPNGSNVGWPPLYDWTIALISNLIGLGHPSIHLIETVGVYFPAILGGLSVIVIYFLCKEIFNNHNWQIGFISGLLLAIIPAFVQVSFLGFVDHHVAEVLLSSTMYLFILKALKNDKIESEKNKNKRIFFVFGALGVLLLAILTWPGTPIFIGIVLIFLILQTIIERRYKYLSIILAVILLTLVGLYLKFPDEYNLLKGGISFLTREGPVLQQIVETQPLFFTFRGEFTINPSWYAFNTALYIGVLGLIFYIKNSIKEGGEGGSGEFSGGIGGFLRNRVRIFFLVWTFIVFILNLYQTRFIYLFAVNLVILCSYVITEFIYSKKEYVKTLGLILLIAIIIPSLQTVNTMIEHPLMLSNDWFNSLEWLKQNTPNPGNWNSPVEGQEPDYGVMEWWDYGNYILYLSQRPVVANNFQLGIYDSANFFASENITDANNIMNKRKAKYVIVDYRLGLNPYISGNRAYLRGAWVSLALLKNKELSYYLDKNNFPNDRYLNTMYAKLYLFDAKGLNNYKLIYKSQSIYPDIFNQPIQEIKIFEYNENGFKSEQLIK